MSMADTAPKNFSIRTLLFVTFAFGVFLAAARDPKDAMVTCTGVTLISSVAVAWYVCLRDEFKGSRWILAFAISATLFSLDLYQVPGSWKNAAFAALHPELAADHARSVATGFSKEAVAFGYILDDALILLLAIGSATLVGPICPNRFPAAAIFLWIIVASSCLIVIHEIISFLLSVASGIALTAAWFVILRNLAKETLPLTAFTLATTLFMLITHNRMLPDFNFYEMLHESPPNVSDLHQERFVFQSILRDCFAIWFGSIIAVVVTVGSRDRTSSLTRGSG